MWSRRVRSTADAGTAPRRRVSGRRSPRAPSSSVRERRRSCRPRPPRGHPRAVVAVSVAFGVREHGGSAHGQRREHGGGERARICEARAQHDPVSESTPYSSTTVAAASSAPPWETSPPSAPRTSGSAGPTVLGGIPGFSLHNSCSQWVVSGRFGGPPKVARFVPGAGSVVDSSAAATGPRDRPVRSPPRDRTGPERRAQRRLKKGERRVEPRRRLDGDGRPPRAPR